MNFLGEIFVNDLEKQFEKKVKEFLKKNKCWFVKYWNGGAYTKNGTPDILACINGFFVGLELKVKKNRPSDIQKYQIKEIKEAGGIAMSLRPENFNELEILVKELMER